MKSSSHLPFLFLNTDTNLIIEFIRDELKDIEVVYDQALNADFWRLIISQEKGYSYEQLISENQLYADFRAVKNKGVLLGNCP